MSFEHAPNIRGTAPAAHVTDEMLKFRESFNRREHLAGQPQAAPVDPALIHLSRAQLKMLCERAGMTVIDDAPGNGGGRLLNLEEKYEALKTDHDALKARYARLSVIESDKSKLCDKMAAHMIALDAEIVELKAKLSTAQNLNTEAPIQAAEPQETQNVD